MDNRFPDPATVRAAIAMAIRAPSLHNSQPWRWWVHEHSIHLFADASRLLPGTDPDGRQLIISCGATLHHLRVSLSALGWNSAVNRLPDRSDPRHLAAIELNPAESSADAVALAALITRRRSDRRPYRSTPLPPFAVTLVHRNAAGYGLTARMVTEPRPRRALGAAIAHAYDSEARSDGYRNEVAAWSGQHFGADDGVPARNVPPANGYDGIRLRSFSHPEMPVEPATGTDPGGIGTLIVLGTAADDVSCWLSTGEATGAILLTATGFGLASCPLTQPLDMPHTRRLIRDTVLDAGVHPQMILRVGYPTTQAEVPVTPRRAVADVLDTADDNTSGSRPARRHHRRP
ncbi:MAG: hypothetical protein WCG47_30000 [Dermatophilaceae bacterium]